MNPCCKKEIKKALEKVRISYKDLPAFKKIKLAKIPDFLIAISNAKIDKELKKLGGEKNG